MTEFPINATYWPISPDHPYICAKEAYGSYICPDDLWCGSPIEYGISLKDDNVYDEPVSLYGIANFDHFGFAFLSVV